MLKCKHCTSFLNRIWFYKVIWHGERKAPTHWLTQSIFQFHWKEKISPLEGTEGPKNPRTTLYMEQLIAVISTQGFTCYHCCAVYFYNRRQFDCDRLCLMALYHFIVRACDSPCALRWPLVGRPVMLLSVFPGSNEWEVLLGDEYFATPISNPGVINQATLLKMAGVLLRQTSGCGSSVATFSLHDPHDVTGSRKVKSGTRRTMAEDPDNMSMSLA